MWREVHEDIKKYVREGGWQQLRVFKKGKMKWNI